jgi:outer membrane protein assembly factor BamB
MAMKKAVTASRVLFLLIVAVLAVACHAVQPDAASFDWPRWRGPDGDGTSREAGWNPMALEGGPRILWKTAVGFGHSGVAIQDGRVYTIGSSGETRVYCLRADNGRVIWKSILPTAEPAQATPTVDGDRLYALTCEGSLVCFTTKRGSRVWARDLVAEFGAVKPYYGFAGSPVIEKDLVILTANSAGMALDKDSGDLVWRSEKPPETARYFDSTGTEYQTPVLYTDGERRFGLVSSYRGLHSVDVRTGEALLLLDWGSRYGNFRAQTTDPLAFDGKVFIAGCLSRNIGGVLMDVRGGKPRVLWTSEDTHSEIGSPVIVDGFIYVCQGGPSTGPGALRCLDVRTGTVMWEEPFEGNTLTLTAADGKLIVLSERGMLYVVEASPRSFTLLSSCDLMKGVKKAARFWSPPVLCNGRIYCKDSLENLICVDVRR